MPYICAQVMESEPEWERWGEHHAELREVALRLLQKDVSLRHAIYIYIYIYIYIHIHTYIHTHTHTHTHTRSPARPTSRRRGNPTGAPPEFRTTPRSGRACLRASPL